MSNGGQIKYSIGFDVNTTQLNQLKTSLQQIKQMTVEDLIKINPTVAQNANNELQKIKHSASEIESALTKAFNTNLGTLNVAKFNQELKKLDLDKIYADFSKMGSAGQSAFRNLTSQILTTNMKLKETHTLMSKMTDTMARTVKWGVASSIMNNFSNSVRQAYGYVKSLDTSLNNIRIVTEKSSEEMSKFAVEANNAAKELGQTTTNYTDAALIYYQQGLSDEETKARAETTLKAANVTGQTGEEVSEQLTAVWNGYKVSAEETELYVDKLAAVAASTASDLEELSVGMSKVASAAMTSGVDIDQLSATLSTVISVTRQAPETVGTAFKTIYARLGDLAVDGVDEFGTSLGQISSKMKTMGIEILDETGNMREMGTVVEEVAAKWDTWTSAQKQAAAVAMAGKRQYNNLIALFENWESYEKSLLTSANAAGTLQTQQDIYMDSTAAHLKQLKASSEDLYDSILDPKGMNIVIDGLRLVTDLASNFVDSIGGMGGVLLGLGSIGTRVFSQQIANGLATFITNMRTAKENAAQLRAELEITQQIDTSKLNNSQIQQLVDMKKRVLELNKSITNEERNLANEYIRETNELFKQEDALEAKKQAAAAAYQRATGDSISLNSSNYNTAATAIEDKTRIQENLANNAITSSQAAKAYAELSTTAQKWIDVANLEQTGDKEVAAAQDALTQKIKEHNSTVMNQLKLAEEAVVSGELEENNKKELVTALEKLNQLRREDGTLNLNNKKVIERLAAVEKARTEAYKSEIQTRRQLAEEIRNFARAEQEAAEKSQNLDNSWKGFLSTINLRSVIQNITQTVSAFGMLASSINTIRQLGSIWSNEDISTGEKILQTVTNLGFALPMLATSIGQVSTALGIDASLSKAATTAKTAYAIASAKASLNVSEHAMAEKIIQTYTAKGISIETAHAFAVNRGNIPEKQRIEIRKLLIQVTKGTITAEAADAKMKDILAGANTRLAFSFKGATAAAEGFAASLGPVGWIFIAIGAISGLVAVLGNSQQALKEQVETYKEAETELSSLTDELETTQNRIQELMNLASKGDLSLVEEKELKNLQSKNIKLQTQIELQERLLEIEEMRLAQDAARSKGTFTPSGDITPFNGDGMNATSEYQVEDETETAQKTYTSAKDNSVEISTEDVISFDEVKLTDPDSFEQWTKDMLSIQNEAVAKQVQATKDGNKNEAAAYEDIANQIGEDIEVKTEDWSNKYTNYLSQLGEGYETAMEVLPALQNQNTMGQYDSEIEYYQGLVHDYLKTAGTLESTIATIFDGANISNTEQEKIASSDKILDEKNKTVNEDVLKDEVIGIGKAKFEKLEEYAEIAGLSLYDLIKSFQEANKELQMTPEELAAHQLKEDEKGRNALTAKINELDYGEEINVKDLYNNSDLAGKEVTRKFTEIDENGVETEVEAKAEMRTNLPFNVSPEDIINNIDWSQAPKNVDEFQDWYANQVSQGIQKAQLDTEIQNEGLDSTEIAEYGEYLQKIADTHENIDDTLDEDPIGAEKIAYQSKRAEKGIENFNEALETYGDVLENGEVAAEDWESAANDVRSSMSDILGLSEEDMGWMTDDYIAENFDEIKKAAEGDVEAIQNLWAEAGKQHLIDVDLDIPKDQFNELNTLTEQVANEDLEIGATIDDSQYAQQLYQMMVDSNATAEQIAEHFNRIGWEPEVEVRTEKLSDYDVKNGMVEVPGQVDVETGEVKMQQIPVTSKMKADDEITYTVIKGKTKNGNFTPNARRRSTASVGSGSGGGSGGGGGGGGGTSKAKKTYKTTEKKRDRYREVNNSLKKVETELGRLNKEQERLFGKDLLDNLNEQTDILEKQISLSEKKLAIAKKEAAEMRNSVKNERKGYYNDLKDFGIVFDKNNNITNYQEKMKALDDEIARRNRYFNSKSAKWQESAAGKRYTKEIERLEANRETLEKLKEEYDTLLFDTIPGIVDEITDAAYQQIELKMEAFQIEADLRLDVTEAKRDWADFESELAEFHFPDNLLEQNQPIFDMIQSEMGNMVDTVLADGTTVAMTGTANALYDEITTWTTEWQKYRENPAAYTNTDFLATNADGTIQKDGDGNPIFNEAAFREVLQERSQDIQDDILEMEESFQQLNEAYLDSIDAVAEGYEEQLETLEYIGNQLEHNIRMTELLKGENAYEDLAENYKLQRANIAAEIQDREEQIQYYKARMDAETDEKAKQEWRELYLTAIEDYESSLETAAEIIQNEFENAVNLQLQKFDEALGAVNSQGDFIGTRSIKSQWEIDTGNAEKYLDTVEKTYGIQNFANKVNQGIAETDSLPAQRKLNKLLDEQLKKLREKDKLTKYDLDRANALYELELKKIALEEAQNNKSQMRLRRDSSGNYSYQFVADDTSIAAAQQELLDAQNNLYNLDKEAMQERQGELWDVYQEYQDLMVEYSQLTVEEQIKYEEEYAAKFANLQQRMVDLGSECADIQVNLTESATSTMTEAYRQMGEEIGNFTEDILPAWSIGMDELIAKINNPDGSFKAAMESVFEEVKKLSAQARQDMADLGEKSAEAYVEASTAAGEWRDAAIEATGELKTQSEELGELNKIALEYRDTWREIADYIIEAAKAANDYYIQTSTEEADNINTDQNENTSSGGSSGSSSGNNESNTKHTLTDKRIRGIAEAIVRDGANTSGWKKGEKRKTRINRKFKKNDDTTLTPYEEVQEYVNDLLSGAVKGVVSKANRKKYYYKKFDTGGYTGEWNGNDGKMAMLHQKELVLNQADTKNLLSAIYLLRNMADNKQNYITQEIKKLFNTLLPSNNNDLILQDNIDIQKQIKDENILNNNLINSLLEIVNSMSVNMDNLIRSLEPHLITGSEIVRNESSATTNIDIHADFPNANSAIEIEKAFTNLVNMATQRAFSDRK